jgi:hypothetical protein
MDCEIQGGEDKKKSLTLPGSVVRRELELRVKAVVKKKLSESVTKKFEKILLVEPKDH